MAYPGDNKVMLKVKGYVKENWGSPFIVGFMLLLVGVAVSLSEGLSSLADGIAICVLRLIVGVILQLVCFVKYREKVGEAEAV